jgi:hypothetical protein
LSLSTDVIGDWDDARENDGVDKPVERSVEASM